MKKKPKTNTSPMSIKGFSLLELIMYIALLSLLLVGVFSSTLGSIHQASKKPSLSSESYKLLIQNFHE